MRLARYLNAPKAASCKTEGCANAEVPVSDQARALLFGPDRVLANSVHPKVPSFLF